MGVPEGSFAVAALVVLALPGIIYGWVRRKLSGETAEDRNVALAFARGIVFAIVLTATYMWLFGGMIFNGLILLEEDRVAIEDPQVVGALVLGLYVAVPFVLSILFRWRQIEWVAPWKGWPPIRPRPRYGYASTPTSWDFAARSNHQAWVKVRKKDGHWVGGWFTSGSHATTYPEPPSIYIGMQYSMSPDGQFGEPKPDAGVWVAIEEGDIVMWTQPGRDAGRA